MWWSRSGTTVFVPRVAEGSRVAHSQKLLETTTRLRIRAEISMEPLPRRRDGEHGASLVGRLLLTGPHARVLFRREREGAPDLGAFPVEAGGALLPTSPRITIPEYRVRSRYLVAPFVWVTFVNSRVEPLSASYCLGRCDHDPIRIEPVFDAPARLSAWLSARDVNERRGPEVGLRGELYIPQGIFLLVRMAASCNRRGEPEGSIQAAETPVLPPGTAVEVPQRVVTPGIAGIPWVSVALRGGESGANESEIPVGRCVRLD